MKPKTRWPDAYIALRRLYDERVRSTGMTEEEFGAEYGIGSQPMVWQYLNGKRPLGFEAAAKFAEGLRCTIKDISPEMDKALREEVLPAMGLKAWRRAAVLALLALLPQFAPSRAEASISHNESNNGCILSKSLSLYTLCENALRWLKRAFLHIFQQVRMAG